MSKKRSLPLVSTSKPLSLLDQIDDPTDFTLPLLAQLDATLRCPICAELLVGPVLLTSCCHTFCSRCLRESLSERRKCPQCSVEADTSKIRKNPKVEEAVQAWQKARPALLQLQAVASTSAASTSRTSSPLIISSSQKRVKTESSDTSTKRSTRFSFKDGKNHASTSAGETMADADDLASSDIEIIEFEAPSKRPKRGGSAKLDLKNPNIEVKCPICQSMVRNADLNRHIDAKCAEIKPASKGAWSGVFGPSMSSPKESGDSGKGKEREKQTSINGHSTTKALPQISYTGMKSKKINELLEEFDLDTSVPLVHAKKSDSKVTYLCKRHERWTTIWNSNSDVAESDPRHKSPKEMRQELKTWEDRMAKQEDMGVGNRAKYAKEHEDEFRELIRKGKEVELQRKRKLQEEEEEKLERQSEVTEGDVAMEDLAQARSATSTLEAPNSQPKPDTPSSVSTTISSNPNKPSVRFARLSTPEDPLPEEVASPVSSLEENGAEPASDDSEPVIAQRPRSSSQDANRVRAAPRSVSPFDPRGPRASQRNRQEEEMWARRAQQEEEQELARERSKQVETVEGLVEEDEEL